MAVCPSCRRPVSPAGRICPHCGTELPGRTRLGSAPGAPSAGDLGRTLVGTPPLEPARAPASAPLVSSAPPIARRFEGGPADTWFGHVDPRAAAEDEEVAPTAPPSLEGAGPVTHRSSKPTPAEEAWFRVRGPAPARVRRVRAKAQAKPAVRLDLLGVSMPWWALLVGLVGAAALGGTLALVVPRPPGLRVIGFEVSADGQDQLTVSCGACSDASTLHLGDARAKFQGGVARLASSGLEVGENRLPLELELPDGARSRVEVTVALAFRVSTDLRGISEVPPYALVVVAAPRGTSVTVGGTPQPMDAGVVRSRVELGSEASGPASRPVELYKKIPVRVLGPDLERDTQATIAASIVPLFLDPAPPAGQTEAAVLLAGTTAPGAEVRLLQSGRTLGTTRADAHGRFALRPSGGRPGRAIVASSSSGRISRQVACQLPSPASSPGP